MTDLITRLYALADTLNGALPMEPRQLAQAVIREAADALEQLIAANIMGDSCRRAYPKLEEEAGRLGAEVVALKAKLAEAETELKFEMEVSSALGKERDEARAEAAALREAAAPFPDERYCNGFHDCPQHKLKAALSQPGPGAALLDKLKRYEDALRWYAYEAWTSRDDMGMWVHKLDRDGGDRARAALEEKP